MKKSLDRSTHRDWRYAIRWSSFYNRVERYNPAMWSKDWQETTSSQFAFSMMTSTDQCQAKLKKLFYMKWGRWKIRGHDLGPHSPSQRCMKVWPFTTMIILATVIWNKHISALSCLMALVDTLAAPIKISNAYTLDQAILLLGASSEEIYQGTDFG